MKQSAANDEVCLIHAHEHSLSVPLWAPHIVTVVKTYHTILFVDCGESSRSLTCDDRACVHVPRQ
jgi:hypothetical protein